MTLQITIVVGNPKPRSRTLVVAQRLAEALFSTCDHRLEIVDLALHSHEVLSWPSDRMAELNAMVAASDVALFASPTYKATYTGLLKAFLDRYSANGLAGVVAIPVMTGADRTHAMGPTVNLAPLLMELGAVVPGRGLYFVIDQMDRIDEIIEPTAARLTENISRVANVARFVGLHCDNPTVLQ